MTCLFCKIVKKEIPAIMLHEDSSFIAFFDVAPAAPTHILIVPKSHISTINETDETSALLLGQLILTAKNLAEKLKISDSGYRLVFNVNNDGGQTVYHIHLHLLGGRQLTWPPG